MLEGVGEPGPASVTTADTGELYPLQAQVNLNKLESMTSLGNLLERNMGSGVLVQQDVTFKTHTSRI